MGLKKRRKAQITPFVIIGIVLIIIISAAFYINSLSRKTPFDLKGEELTAPKLTQILNTYITGCIDKESPELIRRLGMQGGTLYPREPDYLYYNTSRVRYLCYSEGLDSSWSCVNTMLTKQAMEAELSAAIEDRMESCINLDEFSRFALNLETGKLEVNVTIAKDDVVVYVSYPIDMIFESAKISAYEFSSKIDYPLGRLYTASQDIINSHIEDDQFDIDRFMVDNKADIMVEKHRPYPDTVYILSKNDYVFQFAVQELPTIGQFVKKKNNYYGCCINPQDNVCFKNTDPLKCVDMDGEYNPNVGCSCVPAYEPEDSCGGNCNDCDSAGKKHGDSWCAYDTVTGNGLDYVGSRHYKLSCINGTVLSEECRDYRDELCTENVIVSSGQANKTKAVCRTNRWYTCYTCDTKTCCDDKRYRDCYWNENLDSAKRCVPQVPPGLRFWENEGSEVCLRGNSQKECNGFSCPQSWLDSSAEYCYSQGDCGNYRNMMDVLSTGGFYETDFVKNVNSSVYAGGLNRNPLQNGTSWKLNLPLDASMQNIISESPQQFDYVSAFVSSAFSFFDSLSRISISSYLNPFTQNDQLKIKDFTICKLWVSTLEDKDCGFCSDDPMKPCSEYRCKSISERCEFQMKEGIPMCTKMDLRDSSPPNIEIDKSSMQGHTLEESDLAGNEGYTIIDPLKPHKMLNIRLKTDEDTRCTVSLTPKIQDYSLQTVMLGDAVFRKEHNISIRIPPRFAMPQKISDAINFTESTKTLDYFYKIDDIYNRIKNRFSPELQIYRSLTGKDFLSQTGPEVNSISRLAANIIPNVRTIVDALLTQFDNGGYYLFFDCTDRSGNSNDKQAFVRFVIDSNYNDDEPPAIVLADPSNNSKVNPFSNTTDVNVYVDEPAECRYDYVDTDYNSMGYSFDCASSDYSIDPAAGGTYKCNSEAYMPFSDNSIFIRCADKPPTIKSYKLDLKESDSPGIIQSSAPPVEGYSPLDYAKIEQNTIYSPADMLKYLEFGINSTEIGLQLYIDDNMQCRYSENDNGFTSMEYDFNGCVPSDDIKRGGYMCSAMINPKIYNRTIGDYKMKLVLASRSKLTDADLSRISMDGSAISLNFDKNLLGSDAAEINFANLIINLRINETTECSFKTDTSEDVTQMDCLSANNVTACTSSYYALSSANITFECRNSTETGSGNREYSYFIKCSLRNSTARNINNWSYEYHLTKAKELKILDLKPSGVINTTSPEISLKVTEDIIRDKIECGYNENPYSYLRMERSSYDSFKAQLSGLSENRDYIYYIKCKDNYGSQATATARFKIIK